MKLQSGRWMVPFVTLLLAVAGQSAPGQGIVIPGAGPVNRGMAGTGVAAPLDAAGALLWNPAALSGLQGSEFLLGLELLDVNTHVQSTLTLPPAPTFSGETRSDSGVSALPTVALTFQPEDSPWTFGLGLFSIGGFGANFPGAAITENPILASDFFGAVYSKLAVLQLVPTAALRVTDRLSIGFAPTVVIADAALDGTGAAWPFPTATHARTHWGLGFQGGIYYEAESPWRFGASYKSPQWIEEFTFFSAGQDGAPLRFPLNADYPAITSVGAAYYGLPRTVWAIDCRYLDYENTDLFGDVLGWRSVFAVSTGLQYELTERLTVRGGYLYNQNPVPDEQTIANVAAPAIYQHILALGASVKVTCRTSLSIAYLHAFENSIEGPVLVPNPNPPPPAVPAGSVGVRQTVDALVAGLQVHF